MLPRLLLASLMLCATVHAAAAELPEMVQARMREAGIPLEAAGIVVRRMSDGATVLSYGAERSLQPASTLKLLTALVALEQLGPAYRGRTELRAQGEVQDGVLKGDLVLRGLGDVDLDWLALDRMLRAARQAGIHEIRGDLVLDRSLFAPSRPDLGAAPFDESPEFRYNVIPDALLLNTNLLQLDLVADGSGMSVAMTPLLENVAIGAELTLVDRACEDWEDGWQPPTVVEASGGRLEVRLKGEFPRHCSASTAINVLDRTVYADRLFRSLWTHLGGTFHGRAREGVMSSGARGIAEHRSRPLSEVVRDVNKRSDNPVARVLYLTLGALSDRDAGLPTARRSEAEVRAWLVRRGIGGEGLVLDNGSGLSRTERIRPSQLAAILAAGSQSEWAPEFLASLPIVAVDGAMRNRLRDSAAAGRARIKTGTLRDVSAVAGFVKDAGGETHVVVALINHPRATARVTRPILDSLIRWVAERPAQAR
jgi:D-alanyl-D-alanine carboxypeptidase/D-alanyl-D-alanine-endopeptidase (penicillin-binding protein 4)